MPLVLAILLFFFGVDLYIFFRVGYRTAITIGMNLIIGHGELATVATRVVLGHSSNLDSSTYRVTSEMPQHRLNGFKRP